MPLEEYKAKRDFRKTREPAGDDAKAAHKRPIFVVQEHHASHLHYDFRLEADGVLKSWAVPKGPPLEPGQKRLAVQVEDHPRSYATFEGTIPEGQYGAGTVTIWDHGTYDNRMAEKAAPQTVSEAIDAGRLELTLHGEKLRGDFALIRMKGGGRGKPQWLLIKLKDEKATRSEPSPRRRTTKLKDEVARPETAAEAPKTTRTSSGSVAPARTARAPRPPKDVEVTHPEKVLFPEGGLTKGDVFAYYDRIADRLLPFLKDRPATLERLPDGLAGEGAPHFWQKDTPDYYPDWIPRVELPTERGKLVRYALVNNRQALLYLVNQGTVTFHVWASRVGNLDVPDFVLFDLDPGKAPFAQLVEVALALHSVLEAEGVKSYVKTSGKTGLHVLTPWRRDGGYDEARAWALKLAGRVAGSMPERATVEIRKAKRNDRVYIDVLQNARGHHAVPPYVLRAVPAATISTPLGWEEVTPELDPAAFTPKTIFQRLSRLRRDPFAGLLPASSTSRRPRAVKTR